MTSEGLNEQEQAAEAARRVALGAELLDQQMPGWETRIDLSVLDLANACRCVLGQVYAEVAATDLRYMDGFEAGTMELELFCDVMPEDVGFDRTDEIDFHQLDEAWITLIKGRHDAGFPPSSRSLSSAVDLSGKRP